MESTESTDGIFPVLVSLFCAPLHIKDFVCSLSGFTSCLGPADAQAHGSLLRATQPGGGFRELIMSGMDLAIIALPASALAIEVLGERNNDSASRQFARISDSDISVLVESPTF